MPVSPPVCVWLKRDLRVTDHAALAAAVERSRGGGVFAAFLYEPEVLGQPEWNSSHTAFQAECLRDLEPALGRLGIRLVTRRGEAVATLEQLRVETGFTRLLAHEETGTGVTYARDRRVRQWARAAGVEFLELPQTGVVRRLPSRNGWNRRWEDRMESPQAIEFQNMLRAADGLREREIDADRLAAWEAGRTGYPLVDACMRSLVATGWLTFRMRALLVSFAAYSLWLHWRPVGLHLARQFLDFEPGIHWSQLQMQSGTTGINTLRIYNPTKQAFDQDPHGIFIRRWLPELAGVPDAYLHEPWTQPAGVQQSAGCRIGRDYPAPIVNHAAAVREAKRRLAEVRGSTDARMQARDVARRHGSRKDRRGAMQQDPVRRQLQRKPPDGPPSGRRSAPDPQRRLPFADDAAPGENG
jgi:deoxyribodipyrimidine photo-lyase